MGDFGGGFAGCFFFLIALVIVLCVVAAMLGAIAAGWMEWPDLASGWAVAGYIILALVIGYCLGMLNGADL